MDDKIAESEKWLNTYKDKVKENEDILKKNEELRIASENARAEAEKYNKQMEDLDPEYSRALSASVQAYKDKKAGKITPEEAGRLHREFEEIENKNNDLLGKANDASYKADHLKGEIDKDAERRLKVNQKEVKKLENELQDLKNQKQEAYDNYFKAIEKYKEADAKYKDYFGDKKVTVDSEGNVSVEGEQQSKGLSLIEYDSGGNPLWNTKYYVKDNIFSGEPSGPVQSLNPRSTLLMRGRTPANPENSTEVQGELQPFEVDKPSQQSTSVYSY